MRLKRKGLDEINCLLPSMLRCRKYKICRNGVLDLNNSNVTVELDRIKAKIISLCEAGLASGRPYLLSELGLALAEDLSTLKHLTRGKLIDFIRDRLSGRF